MSSDFYQVLGLEPGASKDEIRKAYRKLAMKEHPDKGGDAEKFKKISEAYEILSDDDKRNQYENRGGPRIKLRTHVHHIDLTMEDLMLGKQVNLKVTLTAYCSRCQVFCSQCGGSGSLSPIPIFTVPCPPCGGQGTMHRGCSECSMGRKETHKTIEINIVPGTQDGHQEIFEGFGEQKRRPNEVSGDLIVVFRMKPHHLFTREGDLIVYTHQLNLCDMIIGTEFDVPLFDGPYHVRVNGIINPTRPHIIPAKRLKIQWVVEYPNKTLNDIEKQIVLKILSPVP